MKSLTINAMIALLAFCVGVACELTFNKYLETTSPSVSDYFHNQPELIDLAKPLPSEKPGMQLPPGSLPAVLQRIDETYRKRCQLPTDWNGDWPTIKQLARLSDCNDEWARARRNAIKAELENYLVHY